MSETMSGPHISRNDSTSSFISKDGVVRQFIHYSSRPPSEVELDVVKDVINSIIPARTRVSESGIWDQLGAATSHKYHHEICGGIKDVIVGNNLSVNPTLIEGFDVPQYVNVATETDVRVDCSIVSGAAFQVVEPKYTDVAIKSKVYANLTQQDLLDCENSAGNLIKKTGYYSGRGGGSSNWDFSSNPTNNPKLKAFMDEHYASVKSERDSALFVSKCPTSRELIKTTMSIKKYPGVPVYKQLVVSKKAPVGLMKLKSISSFKTLSRFMKKP